MYSRDDYRQQITSGILQFNTGVFYTDDGKAWISAGNLDYGNNCEFEIMVLKKKPALDESFRYDQYPVFLLSHEETENLGTPLPEFLEEILREEPHHLNTVVQQIGCALKDY